MLVREISIVFPTMKKGILASLKNTSWELYEESKNKEETKPLHHQIRFIDSFKFMATSLGKLVNNLPKDDFRNLKRYYEEDKLNLITRKGVYPYEYMDSPE